LVWSSVVVRSIVFRNSTGLASQCLRAWLARHGDAATSILRQTGDLELVRQVLRHENLAMALRYAHLTKPDVSAKFRRASPLDNLRVGR